MKQFISVPLLFAALLMTNSSSISTSTIDSYSEYLELEMNEVKIDGDYLTPMSVLGVTGNVLGNGYQHISDRLSAFADEYECDCYLGLWTSIENSGYASLDAIVKDWAQYYMDEDSVCILYIDESKDAYVHVGSNIAQDFDKDGLIETLCEEGEKDEFYRMAHTFDDLCDQVGHSTGRYVSKINRIGEGGDEQEIKNALIPLHEVFSGYVCVDYYSGVADDEGSVLRKSREIDYDETFEVWEHELEYYYDDTIYITYYSDTGKAYIDIGKDVEPEFSGKDISEIETSFRMAENENDFSGFASGITALTEKIANPDEPDRFAVIGIVVIAAVLFAVGVMLIKRHKRQSRSVSSL